MNVFFERKIDQISHNQSFQKVYAFFLCVDMFDSKSKTFHNLFQQFDSFLIFSISAEIIVIL